MVLACKSALCPHPSSPSWACPWIQLAVSSSPSRSLRSPHCGHCYVDLQALHGFSENLEWWRFSAPLSLSLATHSYTSTVSHSSSQAVLVLASSELRVPLWGVILRSSVVLAVGPGYRGWDPLSESNWIADPVCAHLWRGSNWCVLTVALPSAGSHGCLVVPSCSLG